ncbi:MAG: hypothetical protein ACUVT7_03545 [Thermoplasmata archaeon]
MSSCTIAVTMLLMLGPMVGAAAAPAGHAWSMPVCVDRDYFGGPASFPELAIDASGNAVAVWEQMDESWVRSIWANRYVPGAGWGTAVVIQSAHGADAALPCVAMDPGGNATVVWKQQSVRWDIWATRYVAGVGWGVPASIETSYVGDADWPNVGVDRNGNALAVWTRYDGAVENVMSSRYVPGLGWSTPMLVESSAESASMPHLAVDSLGNATAVWHQYDGTRWNIWANRYVVGAGWGTAVPLETSTNPAGNPDVAVDAEGNALAVWAQSDGTRYVVWASLYRHGSGWPPPIVLQSDVSQEGIRPIVEFDADGNAMAVWLQMRALGVLDLWTCRYVKDVGWGSPEVMDTGVSGDIVWRYEGVGYDIAFDGVGDAMVVWSQSDGSRYSPWSCRYAAGTGWEAPTLIETTILWDSSVARVALDSGGTAIAVWEQMDGSTVRILSSRYLVEDDTPPALTLTSPADGVVNTTAVTVAGMTEPGATLNVGGIWVAIESNGSFSCEIALAEGLNTIIVTATDAAGNKATAWRNVTYVNPVPGLEDELGAVRDDLSATQDELDSTKDQLVGAEDDLEVLRSQNLVLIAIVTVFAALAVLMSIMYFGIRRKIVDMSRGIVEKEPPPPRS